MSVEDDARYKLIQKKRNSLTDARDRLAEIAKQKDARVKINELKNLKSSTTKGSATGLQNKAKLTSAGPLQRSVKTNGTKSSYSELSAKIAIKKKVKPTEHVATKTSLSRKTSLHSGSLTRTVSSGVNHQSALSKKVASNKAQRISTERFHPLPNYPNLVTIRNEKLVQTHKNTSLRSSNPQLKAHRSLTPAQNVAPSHQHSVSRRPVSKQGLTRTFKSDVWDSKNIPPLMNEEVEPTRLRITTANSYMDYDAPPVERNYEAKNYAVPQHQSYKRPFEEYSESPESPHKKQAVLSSSIISRLDHSQPPNHPGYKVVVTNLHPVVTYEDVEELFSNIGALKSVRIVRQGIAEIIFVNEDDARRSVEVYHNRQLDGQAMNVTLVARKPFSSSSAPLLPLPHYPHSTSPPRASMKASADPGGSYHSAEKASRSTKSVLRTAGGSSYRMGDAALSTLSARRPQKIALPDVSTIHHALFSGRSGNSDPNLQVYIKLPKQPFRGTK